MNVFNRQQNMIVLSHLPTIVGRATALMMITVAPILITYVKFEQIQTCFGLLEISFRYQQYFRNRVSVR